MLRRHEFQEKINEESVYFEILELKDAFYVWLGNESNLMRSLTVAFPVQKTYSHVVSTKLFGPDDVSKELSERLGIFCFISFIISQ
jgi:hypothetical protein